MFLPDGAHTYEIQYLVRNQVRYFDTYDEVYWNATGSYWAFPIDQARATIVLPEGARMRQVAGYTGGLGDAGQDYRYDADGTAHVFETTRPLASREG